MCCWAAAVLVGYLSTLLLIGCPCWSLKKRLQYLCVIAFSRDLGSRQYLPRRWYSPSSVRFYFVIFVAYSSDISTFTRVMTVSATRSQRNSGTNVNGGQTKQTVPSSEDPYAVYFHHGPIVGESAAQQNQQVGWIHNFFFFVSPPLLVDGECFCESDSSMAVDLIWFAQQVGNTQNGAWKAVSNNMHLFVVLCHCVAVWSQRLWIADCLVVPGHAYEEVQGRHRFTEYVAQVPSDNC